MRNKLVIAAAALMVATPALADAWDFVLINDTGKEIKTIDVAVAGSGTWQPNKIPEDIQARTITAGMRTTVHFDKQDADCKFDIRATFADSSTAVWPAVNVCDNSYVTVHYKNGTPTVSAN